jgi:hypothetical protein
MIVPLEPAIDVARQSHVVPVWFRIAPKDVDKPLADALHGYRAGKNNARSMRLDSAVNLESASDVRRNCCGR